MENTKLDIQLRPKDAAKRMGIGLSTFWKMAGTDPDFPPLLRLGKRCTSVSAAALDAYIKNKSNALLKVTTIEKDSIDLLSLRERTKQVLRQAGFNRISDLKSITETELLKCQNLGRMAFIEIKDELAKMNISLLAKKKMLRTKEFADRNSVKHSSVLQRIYEHGHYFGVVPLKQANGRLLWPDVVVLNSDAQIDDQENHESDVPFRQHTFALRKADQISFKEASSLLTKSEDMRDVLALVKEIVVSVDQKRNGFSNYEWCDFLEALAHRCFQIKK